MLTFIIGVFFQGPNFVWHLDGYDKLSQYGLCIHGCIDGLVGKQQLYMAHNNRDELSICIASLGSFCGSTLHRPTMTPALSLVITLMQFIGLEVCTLLQLEVTSVLKFWIRLYMQVALLLYDSTVGQRIALLERLSLLLLLEHFQCHNHTSICVQSL